MITGKKVMASAPETYKPERPSKAGLHHNTSEMRRSGGDGLKSKQLDFYQAMKDFQNMFPHMDSEVIEAVLRANNGAVDATIDQLLTMNIDSEGNGPKIQQSSPSSFIVHHQSLIDQIDGIAPPSYNDTMISSNTPALPYKTNKHSRAEAIEHADTSTEQTNFERSSPIPPPRPIKPLRNSPSSTLHTDRDVGNIKHRLGGTDSSRMLSVSPSETHRYNSYRRWNPTMLGSLPADFLCIVLDTEQIKHVSNAPLVEAGSVGDIIRHKSSGTTQHKPPWIPQQVRYLKSHHQPSSEEKYRRIRKTQSLKDPRSRHKKNVIRTQTLSSHALQQRMLENQRLLKTTDKQVDPETTQILEDERLALTLALQNDEFVRELRANQDFMRSLERERRLVNDSTSSSDEDIHHATQQFQNKRQESLGRLELPVRLGDDKDSSSDSSDTSPQLRRRGSPSAESSSSSEGGYGIDKTGELGAFPHTREIGSDFKSNNDYGSPLKEQDDSEFKQQLRNMGSSSKRKVVQLARRFFTRRRKSGKQILRDTSAPSTINLLDDNDDEDDIIDEVEEKEHRHIHGTPTFEPLPGSQYQHSIQRQSNDLNDDVGGFHI